MTGNEKKQFRRLAARSIGRMGESMHGNALEKKDPTKVARCLEMLAEGVSMNKIEKELGIDRHAVIRIKHNHHKVLDARRAVVAEDALFLIEQARALQSEKMDMLANDPEELKKVNLRDLAIPYGIYADKFFAATDGNKVVVEHKSGAPSLEDAIKAIQEAKAALKKASLEVDVTPVKEADGA